MAHCLINNQSPASLVIVSVPTYREAYDDFALPRLYPLLLKLEHRGWIKGRWVEKPGERERCFYKLTPEGRKVLARQRETWLAFIAAVNDVMSRSDA